MAVPLLRGDMNIYMLRTILCGGVLVGLAAASVVFQSLVHVPLAKEYGMMCLSHPSRLIWWDHHRVHQNNKQQSVYELDTDKLVMRSFRQCPWKSGLLRDGKYVRVEPRDSSTILYIMDCNTLEMIRNASLPMIFRGELLNQRYLVTERSGKMFVCDVLAEDPSQLRTVRLSGWQTRAFTQLYLVGDTNLVVELTVSPAIVGPGAPNASNLPGQTNNVHAYQIDEDSIRLVASWNSGLPGAGISRVGDTLLSLSPDGLTLEGRDLKTFELVRSEPLPKAIVNCLPNVRFISDVCEVEERKTGQRTLYRLDTLEELNNTSGLSFADRGILAIDRLNSPYRMLYSMSSSNQSRIAIYDMQRDRLAWDRTFDVAPAAELLDGDRLVVADSRYGISADIIDLKTGGTIKSVRPYAWLLPGYVLWALAFAFVAFGWIYYSTHAGFSLLTSILCFATAMIPVPVYALTQHGSATNVSRMATSYALAILVSAASGVAWIAMSKLQNRTMRLTYQLAILSVIGIACALLTMKDAFPRPSILPSAIFIASLCALTSFAGLIGMRCFGYRAQWPKHGEDTPTNPTLFQFFTLVAASAGLLIAYLPFRIIPWRASLNVGQVAAFAAPIVVPYLFVFLLLKVSDRWFQRWTIIAAVAAALLVLDFIVAFVFPLQVTVAIAVANLRICLASLVLTFLWLWAFRLRGCTIARAVT